MMVVRTEETHVQKEKHTSDVDDDNHDQARRQHRHRRRQRHRQHNRRHEKFFFHFSLKKISSFHSLLISGKKESEKFFLAHQGFPHTHPFRPLSELSF